MMKAFVLVIAIAYIGSSLFCLLSGWERAGSGFSGGRCVFCNVLSAITFFGIIGMLVIYGAFLAAPR